MIWVIGYNLLTLRLIVGVCEFALVCFVGLECLVCCFGVFVLRLRVYIWFYRGFVWWVCWVAYCFLVNGGYGFDLVWMGFTVF